MQNKSPTQNGEPCSHIRGGRQADTTSPPLLGLNTCHAMNLVKRIWIVDAVKPNFIQEYSDIFGEHGCLKGEHHIEIDKSIPTVIHPPRKIPISMLHKLEAELDRMQKLDVLEKIEEPTDWVSSLVVVEKPNGQICVCLDPKDLNRAIKRQHHPMPTKDEILSKLSGAAVFSKLDASSGYWQIKVDEPSSKLLTFNTPFGRYHFKRLPFGIHSAAEVFQKKVTEIISGLDGVANDKDDIIIFGKSRTEHDQILRKVLDRIRTSGLKFNKNNQCSFGVSKPLSLAM